RRPRFLAEGDQLEAFTLVVLSQALTEAKPHHAVAYDHHPPATALPSQESSAVAVGTDAGRRRPTIGEQAGDLDGSRQRDERTRRHGLDANVARPERILYRL